MRTIRQLRVTYGRRAVALAMIAASMVALGAVSAHAISDAKGQAHVAPAYSGGAVTDLEP